MEKQELINKCKELKNYFRDHYSYIDFEMSNAELMDWVKERTDTSIPFLADRLSDYLLANGAYAQE